MKTIEFVGFSSNGKTSIKNNRNLNKRKGFYESFKKSKRKFVLMKEKNVNRKHMSETELLILRDKLETEYKIKIVTYVFGIFAIIVFVLLLIKLS